MLDYVCDWVERYAFFTHPRGLETSLVNLLFLRYLLLKYEFEKKLVLKIVCDSIKSIVPKRPSLRIGVESRAEGKEGEKEKEKEKGRR